MEDGREVEAKGVRAKIYPDTHPSNPRKEWDNLGTMIGFPRERTHIPAEESGDYDDFQEKLREKGPEEIIDFLYIRCNSYDGTCYAADRGSDSRMESADGVIFVTRQAALKEYSCKRITKKIREYIRTVLRGEVQVFSEYCSGNVWGYVTHAGDSCWGFYGDDEVSGILDAIGDSAPCTETCECRRSGEESDEVQAQSA